jgi:hypothetical protein
MLVFAITTHLKNWLLTGVGDIRSLIEPEIPVVAWQLAGHSRNYAAFTFTFRTLAKMT